MRTFGITVLAWFIASPCWAGQTYNAATGKYDLCSTVQEADGSPTNVGCLPINVPNGTVTNNTSSITLNYTGTPAGGVFTAGSIPFGDGTASLAQNNANLFWDNTNARLGIGTASPSSVLHLGSGVFTLPAGTAALPSMILSGAATTGWYQVSSGRWSFSVLGTNFFDIFNNGGLPIFLINNLGSNTQPTLAFREIGNGIARPGNEANALQFITNALERVRINSSGNVGIGTTSPTSGYKLDVAGNIRLGTGSDTATNRVVLKFNDGGYANPTVNANNNGEKIILYDLGASYKNAIGMDANGNMWHQSNSAFTWWTGATPSQVMTLSSGNLGIGTASPSSTVDVQAPSSLVALILRGPGSGTQDAFQVINNAGTTLKTVRFDGLETNIGGYKVTGQASFAGTGAGLEFSYDGSNGHYRSYNRTTAAYINERFNDAFEIVGGAGPATPYFQFNNSGASQGKLFISDGTTQWFVVDGVAKTVGIGATSPSSKLDVQGLITNQVSSAGLPTGTYAFRTGSPSGTIPWGLKQNAADSATPNLANFETSSGSLGYIFASYLNSTGGLGLLGDTGKQLSLHANGAYNTPHLVINTSGNVGIGVTGGTGKARLFFGGTSEATTDWAASAGWGASATISAVTGTDNRGTVTVTTNAADTPTANPTITLTFKDGTWTSTPFCMVCMDHASTGPSNVPVTCQATATTIVVSYRGTPTATSALTYKVNYMVLG